MNNGSGEVKEEPVILTSEGRRLFGLTPMLLLVALILMRISWTIYKNFGQKTRNPQRRRPFQGTQQRPSLGATEPNIYLSPSNLPPPPKYEFMAPPSYEEVVGVHYPNYQVQPITQPITAALSQDAAENNATGSATNNVTSNDTPATTVTVTSETGRTTIAVQN